MDIRKLQRAIVDGLEEVKAQDIVVYNTERLSPLFERVVIASGTSNRQTKALASSVRETVKKRGLRVLSTEGEANGEWIIVDCGAAVAHIMQPAIRAYYNLEEIWGGKTVTMKTAAAAARLPKAAAPAPSVRTTGAAVPTAKAAARRAGAGRVAAQGVPAKATSAKTTSAKAISPKATAAKRAPAERAPAERASAGRAPAENARATKAAPRRAATGPAAAKPRVAKKAPARKPAPNKPAPRKPAVEALAQPAGKSARPAARKAPRS